MNSQYNAFLKLVKVSIFLDNSFTKSSDFDQIMDENVRNFCKNNCTEWNNFENLFDEIERFQIKKGNKKF